MFHEPTTGASNDIEKATATARAMVTEYGMSAKLGSGQVRQRRRASRSWAATSATSATTPKRSPTTIDAEVRSADRAARTTRRGRSLDDNRDILDDLPR